MVDRANDWTLYADHRAHFTEALCSSAKAPGASSACSARAAATTWIWNDCPSPFRRFIWSTSTPPRCKRRCRDRKPEVRARLHRHAPVDLSGIFQAPEEVETACADARRRRSGLGVDVPRARRDDRRSVRRRGVVVRAHPDVVRAARRARRRTSDDGPHPPRADGHPPAHARRPDAGGRNVAFRVRPHVVEFLPARQIRRQTRTCTT